MTRDPFRLESGGLKYLVFAVSRKIPRVPRLWAPDVFPTTREPHHEPKKNEGSRTRTYSLLPRTNLHIPQAGAVCFEGLHVSLINLVLPITPSYAKGT